MLMKDLLFEKRIHVQIAAFGFLWAILYHLTNSLFLPYLCHSITDIIGYLAMNNLITTAI